MITSQGKNTEEGPQDRGCLEQLNPELTRLHSFIHSFIPKGVLSTSFVLGAVLGIWILGPMAPDYRNIFVTWEKGPFKSWKIGPPHMGIHCGQCTNPRASVIPRKKPRLCSCCSRCMLCSCLNWILVYLCSLLKPWLKHCPWMKTAWTPHLFPESWWSSVLWTLQIPSRTCISSSRWLTCPSVCLYQPLSLLKEESIHSENFVDRPKKNTSNLEKPSVTFPSVSLYYCLMYT